MGVGGTGWQDPGSESWFTELASCARKMGVTEDYAPG